MRRLKLCGRMLAMALIVVLLTVRLGSFSHELFVQPIQDYIAKAASLSEDDTRPHPPTFKPKRISADACLLAPPAGVPYLPTVSRLVFVFPFRAFPEVYPEIFIPPDIRA